MIQYSHITSGLMSYRIPFHGGGIEFKYKIVRFILEYTLKLPKYLLMLLEKLYED